MAQTQLFWLCVICSFLPHPCPQPSWPCQSCMMTACMVGKLGISHFKGNYKLCSAKKFSSHFKGNYKSCSAKKFSSCVLHVVWWCGMHLETTVVAWISHALEFRKCQHNMVGFFERMYLALLNECKTTRQNFLSANIIWLDFLNECI